MYFGSQVFSRSLAKAYLKLSLSTCQLTGVEPSFIFHSLDFLGKHQVSELEFFPGMHLPQSHKLDFVEMSLDYFQTHFNSVTLREHAEQVRKRLILTGGRVSKKIPS